MAGNREVESMVIKRWICAWYAISFRSLYSRSNLNEIFVRAAKLPLMTLILLLICIKNLLLLLAILRVISPLYFVEPNSRSIDSSCRKTYRSVVNAIRHMSDISDIYTLHKLYCNLNKQLLLFCIFCFSLSLHLFTHLCDRARAVCWSQ